MKMGKKKERRRTRRKINFYYVFFFSLSFPSPVSHIYLRPVARILYERRILYTIFSVKCLSHSSIFFSLQFLYIQVTIIYLLMHIYLDLSSTYQSVAETTMTTTFQSVLRDVSLLLYNRSSSFNILALYDMVLRSVSFFLFCIFRSAWLQQRLVS